MTQHKSSSQNPQYDKLCLPHLVSFLSMYPSGLPLSGQTDVRLFGAAFAQGEQFPDDLLGFSQDQGGAGLQLGVALLEGQVSRPELGNNGHIQEPVSGQALQEGLDFICRDREGGQERREGRGRKTKQNKIRQFSSQVTHMLTTPIWSAANLFATVYFIPSGMHI